MALCPNCSAQVDAGAAKCPACGAQFSADGWKPVEPQPPQPPAPLTSADKKQGVIIVVAFLVWLPLYLFALRPVMNGYLAARGIERYPAMLHLIPIFAVPVILGIVAKIAMKKGK
jgi:hypothetical protein